MDSPEQRFRCAAASLERRDQVAGTATHVRTWLLLEHTGPWGVDALRDARLPDGLGQQLARLAKTHRAKVLLIRRPRARRDPERLRVFAARTHPHRPRLEHGTVTDPRDVLRLDLEAFRHGGSTGLDRHAGPLFCVCTHGRHDTCCAERGRPVALALGDARPEETWEISHIGGDRFAGNMVVLPHGLYYGRLTPDSAEEVAARHRAGRLHLDHLRGSASYPMAVQAAEIELRRHLDAPALDAVTLTGRRLDGELTEATFATGQGSFVVRVRAIADPATATRLTCAANRDNPVPRHHLESLRRTG